MMFSLQWYEWTHGAYSTSKWVNLTSELLYPIAVDFAQTADIKERVLIELPQNTHTHNNTKYYNEIWKHSLEFAECSYHVLMC